MLSDSGYLSTCNDMFSNEPLIVIIGGAVLDVIGYDVCHMHTSNPGPVSIQVCRPFFDFMVMKVNLFIIYIYFFDDPVK